MNLTSQTLTTDAIESLGRELDALRQETLADLGARDVAHIRGVIRTAQYAEAGGRLLLHVGFGPVSFLAGAGALAAAKILENMEIGHNVMHGQYDWTRDPALDSRAYEWDLVGTSDGWRHSHNYEHHTFTNIVGRDRDVGYRFLRVSDAQPWNATHLAQPFLAVVLATWFQWGIAMHDLRIFETLEGTGSLGDLRARARPFLRKAAGQLARDYALFPALALWNAPRVFAGNLLANLARNVWAFTIIFCGHFPDGVRFFDEDETRDETRGRWYLRQINGSANLEGSRLLHLFSGHLSHQIEHHLFPDVPAWRYPEMAPRVRAICERHGQVYNTGRLGAQVASVARKLVAYAVPRGVRGWRDALRGTSAARGRDPRAAAAMGLDAS